VQVVIMSNTGEKLKGGLDHAIAREDERTRSVFAPEEYDRWKELSQKDKLSDAEKAEYDALENKRLQNAPPLHTATKRRRRKFWFVWWLLAGYLSEKLGSAIAKNIDNPGLAGLTVGTIVFVALWLTDKFICKAKEDGKS
jgi:hypothetical protein